MTDDSKLIKLSKSLIGISVFVIVFCLAYHAIDLTVKSTIQALEENGIVATTKRVELNLNCGLMNETHISNAKNATVVVVSIQGKDGQLVKVMTLDCLSESGRKLSTGLTAPTKPNDTQ